MTSSLVGFQFTHPGRGATDLWRLGLFALGVSIHAPREGCDSTRSIRAAFAIEFQFTHPGRGATDKERILNRLQRVSIHAPREGCDLVEMLTVVDTMSFNSRTPGGVRLGA